VPLFDGGGQERTLRSGTLPVPLVVGLGAACRVLAAERDAEQARLRDLAERLWTRLAAGIPGLVLNGAAGPRTGDTLNIRLPDIDGRAVMAACSGVAMAMGAACASETVTPSYVLTALGLSPAEAAASLRLAPGRPTTAAEIDRAAELIVAAADAVRHRAA
jgi:cysteine desulfurase